MGQRRFIKINRQNTSIQLERTFWDTIDELSVEAGSWQNWVRQKLKTKPDSIARASYLRQVAHQAVLNKIQMHET
jgi:predicted DNA-binding ribbon-helix-helix protein